MGLSRNKVAVSEGAAGSPPFYGEHERLSRVFHSSNSFEYEKWSADTEQSAELVVVQFSVTERSQRPSQYGGVAQLGEHLPCKQGVMGSIPIISTRPGVRAAKYRVEISEIDSVSPDGMRTETMKEITDG